MLRIYADVLTWLEELAKGMYSRGRQRTACYRISLREMRESFAALEIAERLKYVPRLEAAFEDRSQKIIATLVRLALVRQ